MVDSVSGASQSQILQSSSRTQRGSGNADRPAAEEARGTQDTVEISSEALSLAEVAQAETSAAQVRDLLVNNPNETLGRTDANFNTLL